jgi:mRNA interferase HicA
MTSAELKRWLAKQGATFTPGNGSHLHVHLNGKKSVLAMHNADVPKGTHLAILKQLGLKR